jgi:hypothetical protein
MKKVFLALSLISLSLFGKTQFTTLSNNDIYYTAGNVGIGTSAPPAYKLAVRYPNNTGSIGNLAILGYSNESLNRSIVFQQLSNSSTASQYLFLNGGLGSSSAVGSPTLTSIYAPTFGFEANDNYLNILTGAAGTNVTAIKALTVLPNGSIGIGTTAPNNMKLAVDGKIGAREVHVTLASTWPDYVFSNTYKRMNLVDLKAYIKANSHLPNIPSAEEVKENGIYLGDMNAKLLEKIEELTMYVIELKEENDQINKRLQKLENK